jgi:hypothetical protein
MFKKSLWQCAESLVFELSAVKFAQPYHLENPPSRINVRIAVLSSSEPVVLTFQLFFVVESERWSFNCAHCTRAQVVRPHAARCY